MIRPLTVICSLGFMLISLGQSPALHAEKLYKWVDEEGNVRYSDSLPIERSSKRHQTISTDGRILGTAEAKKTPEERRKEREEARRLEAEERALARLRAEQAHNDRVLLMTFTNEDEILEAEQERLSVIDSVINLLKKNIAKEQEKVEELEKRADDQYISKDKAVPGGLAQNIEYFNEKLLNKQKQLELKVAERLRIKQQYASDLIRYRTLISDQSN